MMQGGVGTTAGEEMQADQHDVDSTAEASSAQSAAEPATSGADGHEASTSCQIQTTDRPDGQALQQRLHQAQAQLTAALSELNLLRESASMPTLLLGMELLEESKPPDPRDIWREAGAGFRRAFILGYGVRAGLGLMTKALTLARRRQWGDLASWRLLSEKVLVYREDAVRLGLFMGGFTGVYHLLAGYLHRWRPSKQTANRALAGAVAGLALMVQKSERRRTLALYALVRAAQCWYNTRRAAGKWHFWGSDWDHADTLLFALSSAQVMYAYVMRPETLPWSYWSFIVKSGPISAVVLEAVRRSIRALPVDTAAVNAHVAKQGGRARLRSAFPRQIPSEVLHPGTASALVAAWQSFSGTFRKTFPLYMSLSLVPYVAFNLRRALKAPLNTAAHALAGAVRSTGFLSSFVALYMGAVDLQRRISSGDSKYVYYGAGLVASLAVLIEKKSRRAELALYTLPRAADSFLLTLMHRRWVPSIRFGEVALFCGCMAALMHFCAAEPRQVAPFLHTLISRVVFGTDGKPPPPQRRASFVFGPEDIPGGLEPVDESG